MTRIGLALVALSLCLLAIGLWPGRDASAITGLCGTSHDYNSSEELDLLSRLQSWRNQNVPGNAQLEVSGALNAAAAWFAQWQVEHGSPGGHGDGSRDWRQRAWDCGYTGQTSYGVRYAFGGSGEGVWGVAGSGAVAAGPSQAISGITYSGSGVWISAPSVSLPAKCVGVAVYRNASGTAAAWVAVIAQYPASLPCPASTATVPQDTPTASPSPSPSNTATTTATSTATQTTTPTSTPTPSPTPTQPPVYRSYAIWVTRED